MGTRSVGFSTLILTLMALPQAAAAKAPVKGDFNGDGTADLAISSPRYPLAGVPIGPGSVNVLYAAAHGQPLLGGSLLSQSTPGIRGLPDKWGQFGEALATADFNGDGKADLAIGAPFQTGVNPQGEPIDELGSVNVLYGSAAGITTNRAQYWTLRSPGVPGQASFGQHFGAALAGGDFDGDGKDDLAVGIPGALIGTHQSGAVLVFRGSASGLTVTGIQRWTLASPHILGTAAHGRIGTQLAAGDFDHDGADDLVMTYRDGDPHAVSGGKVSVLYGVKGKGLSSHRNQLWSQSSPGVKDSHEKFDGFGEALATGDFDGDHFADVAIGVPGEGVGAANAGTNFGAVTVLYGSKHGLTAAGNQLWWLGSPGIPGHQDADDEFGAVLAAGDFDGDGRDELVVDDLRATVGGHRDAGEVVVIPGSKHGLTATGSRLWSVDTPGIPGTVLTDTAFGDGLFAGDFDADGRDDLALGIPGVTVHGKHWAGAVDVLFGTHNGLGISRLQRLTRGTSGVAGKPQTNGYFGVMIQ